MMSRENVQCFRLPSDFLIGIYTRGSPEPALPDRFGIQEVVELFYWGWLGLKVIVISLLCFPLISDAQTWPGIAWPGVAKRSSRVEGADFRS
jgi:hypothetical protein